MLALCSAEDLSVNNKVRFGEAFLHYEHISITHVLQEAGGMFTGMFRKKKTHGAGTQAKVAVAFLFVQ